MSFMKKIERNGKTVLLALSWRDIKSPKAGGAEVHTYEMLSRLDKEKYKVYHFSMQPEGMAEWEEIGGITYIRHGNPLTVILSARKFYRRNKSNIDFVIDQCNTHRFFTSLWVERGKRIFYIHQLTKEIWDYSARPPLSTIGKLTEEWMLRLNRRDAVITVSASTKQELIDRGYQADRIKIIYNGVSFEPWKREQWREKEPAPTFIYAGRYSPYKGIDVAVLAFARLKKKYPEAKLWIIGKKDSAYADKKILPICSKHHLTWVDIPEGEETANTVQGEGDIFSWGFVSETMKLELLSRAWALLFPSIREGWGIPITEAGCVGTPSIIFDSQGIKEAVNGGSAGYVCKENSVDGLLEQMMTVVIDKAMYNDMRDKAYQYSSQFLWDKAGQELEQYLTEIQCRALPVYRRRNEKRV